MGRDEDFISGLFQCGTHLSSGLIDPGGNLRSVFGNRDGELRHLGQPYGAADGHRQQWPARVGQRHGDGESPGRAGHHVPVTEWLIA